MIDDDDELLTDALLRFSDRPTRPGTSRHHALYGLARWRKLARYQLRIEPLCKFCGEVGLVVPATVADHVEQHHGDRNKFWLGKLQSLCVPCHNKGKQQIEARGFRTDVGADGWPLDPRHPVWGRR